MGCDIHLKLEKRKINKTYYTHENFHPDGTITEEIRETPEFKTSRDWHPVQLTLNNCWGDRVYGMFAKLADVRNYFQQKIEPIPLRGFPEDAADNTKLAYCYIVIPDDEYKKNEDYYEDSYQYHYINETKANEWVNNGWSKEMTPFGNTEQRKITDPDAHSPNWCTTHEMENAIKEIFWNEEIQQYVGDYIEWVAILGAMKGIEQNGAYECRAVYWLDN